MDARERRIPDMPPKHPILLLSVVNAELWDNSPSLEELSHGKDASRPV